MTNDDQMERLEAQIRDDGLGPAPEPTAPEGGGAPGVSRRAFVRASGILVAGSLLAGSAAAAFGRDLLQDVVQPTWDFVDDRGRTVNIPTPSHLDRVYFSGPIAQIMMFSLAPDLIAGTTLPFTPQELAYLPEGTAALPFMGSLSEGIDLDIEMLREEGVQLVISAVGDDGVIEAIENADAFTAASGIPIVYLDAGFDDMGEAYRKMGRIVGAEARAEEVASFCERIYADVCGAIARVPAERRVRLYYAEGAEGLQTEPFTSAHAYTFAIAGAYNVAEVDVLDAHGMTRVTLDQVRAWNPDVIIAWDQDIRDGASRRIVQDPDWRGIAAVDAGRVHAMPNVPFSWCDRPVGPNRCIGIQWIANLLYPDYYDIDMAGVTREFYQVMWRISLTDEQLADILGT